MARLMGHNGAIPMSYYSPAPYGMPAHQPPYYVIPQPGHTIPYSAAPQYVYSPSSASEHGAPIFTVMTSQSHQHQYPLHNVVPVDTSKKEVILQEALENVLRQQKQQPKAQMVQQIPQGYVSSNARHPVYVIPEGTMLGQPAHYNGYPEYRTEDVGDANCSHLQFGGVGNQQPGGVQFVNSHGIPITASINKSQPYGLSAALPGMQWKLVPVADCDHEDARGTVPVASPKAPSAPVMLLKSPDADSNASDSVPVGNNAVTTQSEDSCNWFLSLLSSKLEDKLGKKDNEDSEGKSKGATAISTANSGLSEVEAKAITPKSVRIIPVTDAPKEKKRVVAVTDAPKEERRFVLEGERSLKERDCSGTDSKTGPSSMKKHPNKPSTLTLKPIRLVPSVDFAKKKEGRHVAGSKQEKQVNLHKSQGKADSRQASIENSEGEEVLAEKDIETVKTANEASPTTEVAAKRAREKSVEGLLSDVKSHTVQLAKVDEPFAMKKRLISDSETAARLIQSAHRGYVVRRCQPLKHLHDIARVKSMLKEYQVLAADRSSLIEICKDPAERTKISEGIMSMILQLDIIQGVNPVVREIRKYTSKEVLKLQSEVDAAMALISVSPQLVNKAHDQTTLLGTFDDGSKFVDKKVATSEEFNLVETNESMQQHHDVATNGHEALASKCEDIVTGNQPTGRREEQPEEQVEDLLRKLLNKLPKFGGYEGPENIDDGEYLDTDDSSLISEVVKRLSFFKEQQRNKDIETRRFNNHEFLADSADAHIENQEESTLSGMRDSGNGSAEVLHSMSAACKEPSWSEMLDDTASDSIFESSTSRVFELAESWQSGIDSVAGGEGSRVAPDVGKEGEENRLLVPEPVVGPTELELQNLAEIVAADSVDAVLTRTEVTIGSVQSMADNKEYILKEGQDLRGSNDTTLQEVRSVDRISSSLPQSASVDVSIDMADTAKLVNVQSELEGARHLTPTLIASGEKLIETSVMKSAVIDGEDTGGMLKASEANNYVGECPTVQSANQREDDEGQGPQILCGRECAADNQSSDSLMDGSTFRKGKILCQNVIGDDKERSSELGAHEERDYKVSIVSRIKAAHEKTTKPDSTKSIADEGEVQDIDLKDDAPQQQSVPTEVPSDSPTQPIELIQDEDIVNKDFVEVKVENDKALEASPDCSNAESLVRTLWNGLHSTCHNSLDGRSSLQSIAEDSKEVAAESTCWGVSELCNIDQHSRIANASDKFVILKKTNVVERMKVQIPNKSSSSQEETLDVDSPTSVLDAVVSMAPAEDVSSDDTAEISLDDTTSEQPSIQAAIMEDPEGMKTQQMIFDSSLYEQEALQLQSAISNLQSLNNEGEFFLNDESLQLESAISDLHSLNNSGQGFLNNLNPVEDRGNTADAMVHCSSLKRIAKEVYLPKPPSLSPETRHVLEGRVSPRDVCERLCPSSASSPSSETELTLTQHLIEENTVLKELVIDVLKWSQWQSSATLGLHKMMEKLALEVLETKTTAKKAVRCKQGRNKKASKKKNKL